MSTKLKPAILIVSQTASQDPSSDRSSKVLKEVFAPTSETWDTPISKVVPDDVREIQAAVQAWTDRSDDAVSLVVTSGGTGFTKGDVTPEVGLPYWVWPFGRA